MPRFQTVSRMLFALLAGAVLCSAAHAAQPVYKCRADGKPSSSSSSSHTYSDRPCPDGKGETLAPPAMGSSAGIPVGDTSGIGTGDARALLELEKERTELARQQAALAREQTRQQAAAAREQRAQARLGRVEVKQVRHCDQLRLQNKWLQEDLAKAHTAAQKDALATRLRRQTESMAVQCPA